MEILKEDDYEEMAAAFQCFQIQTLYQILKRNKVNESQVRKICEDFTHSFGVGIDQFWIESEEGKVFPIVGFTKKHLEYSPDKIYLNNGSFSFAEYAFGNISWFFEEHKPDEEPQKYGPIGETGEPA